LKNLSSSEKIRKIDHILDILKKNKSSDKKEKYLPISKTEIKKCKFYLFIK